MWIDYYYSMSLLSRFFYKRPPDGLLELSDRVFGIAVHLFTVFNFYVIFIISKSCLAFVLSVFMEENATLCSF